MLQVPCHFISFCQNATKNAENLFVNNLQKFQKFTVSSISCFGDIKEVWYEDWNMSLHKPRQIRACFCWITEKFNSRFLFMMIIFLWIFFKDASFVIYSVGFFLAWCLNIFCGIIETKIQISIVCLKKTFL